MGERRWHIQHGSMLEVLPTLDADSFDSCVCDPPYGLGKLPDPEEMLRAWLAGDVYDPGGGGFMGRKWDSFIPGPHCWREVYRVLKPGAHLVAFAGTRTMDLMGLAIRLAGFELRDSLSWNFGSGFPKSLDVSKAIDAAAGAERPIVGRRTDRAATPKQDIRGGRYIGGESNLIDCSAITAPATAAAREWSGWGTALKPGHEPIILARKPPQDLPLKAVGVAANVLKHGTGALNIDGCRVAHSGRPTPCGADGKVHRSQGTTYGKPTSGESFDTSAGRWPPNVLLTHSASCRVIGTRAVKANPTWDTPNRNTEPSAFTGEQVSQVRHGDGQEMTLVYDCAADCPVRELDGQSGEGVSTCGPNPGGRRGPGFGHSGTVTGPACFGDSGTASRFFPQSQWDPQLDDVTRFLYCAKASRAERDWGLEHFAGSNRHPTVKPNEVLRWLCRLVTPPKGRVLDPFAGVASCGIAALLEGFQYFGVELNDTDEEPFVSLGRARLTWVEGGNYVLRAASTKPVQGSLFEVVNG